MKTSFYYDQEKHMTICERVAKNKTYKGISRCHPNDWDFESELLGQHYSYTRSIIQELCTKRDEARAQLKAMIHLYSILEQNLDVNLESVECYTVRRQIKILERDIKDYQFEIRSLRDELRDMIARKDKFYKQVRERRVKQNASGEKSES